MYTALSFSCHFHVTLVQLPVTLSLIPVNYLFTVAAAGTAPASLPTSARATVEPALATVPQGKLCSHDII